MKGARRRAIALGAMLLAAGCRHEVAAPPGPADLLRAYPDHVASVDATQVVLRDGTRLPLSDGIHGKTPAERILRPDLDDMFVQAYRPGRPGRPPAPDEDPGRARYEPFFDRVYGDCNRGEVAPRLRPVRWMPSRGGAILLFNSVNGAADRLEAVVRDLERLPRRMTRYLVPAAGTYSCRFIAGTRQRSMHAYGLAIDINLAHSDYWLWLGGEGTPYRNRIPFAIVRIFERHGFIWGGKWGHFDTMHFEYRPELLPRR
ncbi:MAG TPA: M15 family metallopeptidase [Allosphingosinicella sp.]|nr:M15 family metallopeptidase [Allosphingosinicella sp.]